MEVTLQFPVKDVIHSELDVMELSQLNVQSVIQQIITFLFLQIL